MNSGQASNDNIISLPAGWAWAKLEELVLNYKNDIVDGPFGSNLHASEYIDEGVPLIRLQNIGERFQYQRHNTNIESNVLCVSFA